MLEFEVGYVFISFKVVFKMKMLIPNKTFVKIINNSPKIFQNNRACIT